MSYNRKSLATAAITMLICCAGCKTAEKLPTQDGATGTTPSSQEQEIHSVIGEVLDSHGFVPPVFTPGPVSVNYAMSGRARSQAELVLTVVRMTAERQVTVELTPYVRIGSSWPSLGRLFRGPMDQEARAMEKEIQERVADAPN